MDDPLSGLLSSPSARPAAAAATTSSEETVFRTVDVSKVKLAAPKPAAKKEELPIEKVDPLVAAKTSGAAKGLGFGVDLWSDTTSTKKASADFLQTIVSSDQQTSFEGGIFDSTATSAAAVVRPSNVDEKATGKVRLGVSVASDETQLKDLTMASKLLEREEELDYATFGKTTHAKQLRESVIHKVEVGSARGDLELESEDVLKRMEGALANDSEPSISKPVLSASSRAAPVAAAPAAIDVDLSKLDLDSYIASQESSGGGGLFD
jgi:hypothetical protein